LSNMLREPGYVRRNLDAGFRFLALSHVLLGYLSALGAHRARLELDAATREAGTYVQQALGGIAAALSQRLPLPVADESREAGM
ncbi:TIGR01666 family membrane protein, partial [Halomonas sp. SIMBA_159]